MIGYSGIWTLLIGASLGVEKFTFKKLIGVVACFAGVVLTSRVDISGENDKHRGSFPHKSRQQISLGDALALLSAVLYGKLLRLLPLVSERSSRDEQSLVYNLSREEVYYRINRY